MQIYRYIISLSVSPTGGPALARTYQVVIRSSSEEGEKRGFLQMSENDHNLRGFF